MSTRLKKLTPYWPPIFVGLLLVVDLLYTLLAKLPVNGLAINYEFIAFYQSTACIIPLLALNGVVILTFHLVSRKSWGSRSRNRANIISIIVFLLVAIPFSYQVSSSWWDQLKTSTFAPQAQVSFHDDFYRLAFIGDGSGGSGNYYLYRCDSLGFSCTRVPDFATVLGRPGSEARIEPDSIHNLLSIFVDGKRIASYSPEQTSPS